MQTRGVEALAGLLDDPLLAGKDDRALTRLEQYRRLERRQSDARSAGDVLQGDAVDPVSFELDEGGIENGRTRVSPGHSPSGQTCCSARSSEADPTPS